MLAGLNNTIWIKDFVKLTTVQTSQKLLQLTTALKIKWTKSELDYTLPMISLENRDVQVQNQDHNTHFETKEDLRDFGSGSILTKKTWYIFLSCKTRHFVTMEPDVSGGYVTISGH